MSKRFAVLSLYEEAQRRLNIFLDHRDRLVDSDALPEYIKQSEGAVEDTEAEVFNLRLQAEVAEAVERLQNTLLAISHTQGELSKKYQAENKELRERLAVIESRLAHVAQAAEGASVGAQDLAGRVAALEGRMADAEEDIGSLCRLVLDANELRQAREVRKLRRQLEAQS